MNYVSKQYYAKMCNERLFVKTFSKTYQNTFQQLEVQYECFKLYWKCDDKINVRDISLQYNISKNITF